MSRQQAFVTALAAGLTLIGCSAARPTSHPAAVQSSRAVSPGATRAADMRACRAFRQVRVVLGQDNSDNLLDPGGGDDAGDGRPMDMMNGTATAAWLNSKSAGAVSQLRDAVAVYAANVTDGVSLGQLSQDERAILLLCT